MRQRLTALLLVFVTLSSTSFAADDESPAAITIYNQQFAVVRENLNLHLTPGVSDVTVTDITSRMEPDSVILRPLTPGHALQILEQNYRNDPVSEGLLLSLYEGKTISFVQPDKKIVQGKIVRSGYAGQPIPNPYGGYVQPASEQPIIEVDGKLQFGLPGQPLFPALGEDTILKPTLTWKLAGSGTDTPAEFSYVTGGFNWHADYNIVAPPKGNTLLLVGWVTLQNQSGKTFHEARVKLMAGDVNKIQPESRNYVMKAAAQAVEVDGAMQPVVREKAFDEFHLYTLQRPTTLHDQETKQVEFVRASGVNSQSIYVYDGVKIDQNYANYGMEYIRNQENYGTASNPKVWVMQEFKNSKENNLGIALPAGRVRFYRQDEDGQLEFTGENMIDHTPKDEMIRLYTGNSFDLVGERRRTAYRMNSSEHWIDESFEIKVRNHKKAPVEVRVVEHLYRWTNWEVRGESDKYRKLDSKTIEFPVSIQPDAEKVVTYTVHYSW